MKATCTFLFLAFATITQAQGLYDIDSILKPLAEKNQKLIGKSFPDFTAMQGSLPVSNKNLEGKVVIVNFWFEGCHPCMAEMGLLNELNRKFKNNKDFEFISFTFDNDAAVKRVKDSHKINFKIFQTTYKECYRLNCGNGFPISFVLDRNGTIKYILSGGGSTEKETRENVLGKLGDAIRKEL